MGSTRRSTSPRLTPELVALVARKVDDPGPAAGGVVHDEDDYEVSLESLLAAGGWQGEDVWVFAYGSLLWNPAFEVAEQVPPRCYQAGIARFAFSSHDSAERLNSRD